MRSDVSEVKLHLQNIGPQLSSIESRIDELGKTIRVVNYRVADVELDFKKSQEQNK